MQFLLNNIGYRQIKTSFCWYILFTGLSLCAFTQPSGDWYLSKILNDNNGLPQNSVGNMYLDKALGFLWMTTEAGLTRYDGVNTKVFDLRDLPSLKTIRMLYIFPTVDGTVLACTRRGEVVAIKDNYVVDKVGYIHGKFFVINNIGSLADVNFDTRLPGKFNDKIGLIFFSVWLNDSLRVVSGEKHLALFNKDQLINRWSVEGSTHPFLVVRNGFCYLINRYAAGYCINLSDKGITNTVVNDTSVFEGNPALFYDKANEQPLLLKNNNLYELQFEKNMISAKFIATLPNLPTDITDIIVHPNKRFIFVATNTTGVYIYRRSSFHVYKHEGDDILNNNYPGVLTDSDHIFTCRSLLFDLNTGTSRKIPLPVDLTVGMGFDSSKNIWSATHTDIVRFKINAPGKKIIYPLVNGNKAQTFLLARNGKFWISTYKYLGYDDNKKLKEYIPYPINYDSSSFYYLTETKDGQLMGVNKSGIYFIDTLKKKFILVVSGKQVSEVRYIYSDSADMVWITTYGNGIFLYKLKEKKLFKLPVDDRGYLLFTHAFIDDNRGNFLVPANKGLFRLNKDNLLRISTTASTPLLYQYFDVSDGLSTNEFNGGCEPAFNLLSNGDIILPALQGLVRVKVNELPVPNAYPLFVDVIETRNKKYKAAAGIRFDKDERTQNWHLCLAQWDQPNSQNIFYRMAGDSSWQRLAFGERNIQLNELTGGDHTLEIKYQYGLLQNQFSSLKFRFYVAKRYYEIVWFWLAVFILLVIFTSMFVRFRNIQLRKKNIQLQKIIKQNTQELFDKNSELEETLRDLNEALNGLKENSIFKNRLIGLLGHDMLVPLRFIATISNHLYNDTEILNPEMTKETSGEIKNTAAELLYLGESLIQWIKLEEGTFRLIMRNIGIEELVNEIVMVHKSIAVVKNNQLICKIPAHLSCVYDPVFIKVILHNLLLNANKFTTGGRITIQASVSGNCLTIDVDDTGIGMQPEIVASLNDLTPVASQNGTDKETGWGMGYLLVIDLLRFANGKLHVQSAVGAGTKVSFSLPL